MTGNMMIISNAEKKIIAHERTQYVTLQLQEKLYLAIIYKCSNMILDT